MAEAKTPLLEVDLGEANGPLQFFDVASLKEWFSDEQTKWSQLVGRGENASRQLTNRFQRGTQAILALQDEPDPAALVAARDFLVDTFNSFGMPLSSSPSGIFVLGLMNDYGVDVAIGALAYLLPQESGAIEQTRPALRGM